jgi:hypothetical protein
MSVSDWVKARKRGYPAAGKWRVAATERPLRGSDSQTSSVQNGP